jgi:hypothetical protein
MGYGIAVNEKHFTGKKKKGELYEN